MRIARALLNNRLKIVGDIKVQEAIRILESSKKFSVGVSSLRNIFLTIMRDKMRAGSAKMGEIMGVWTITKADDLYDLDEYSLKKYSFLDPPKPKPEVDIYNELKSRKLLKHDHPDLYPVAQRLCDEAGISINTLIIYINERYNERAKF